MEVQKKEKLYYGHLLNWTRKSNSLTFYTKRLECFVCQQRGRLFLEDQGKLSNKIMEYKFVYLFYKG